MFGWVSSNHCNSHMASALAKPTNWTFMYQTLDIEKSDVWGLPLLASRIEGVRENRPKEQFKHG